MFIVNKINGIGEILSSNETSYKVYFSETDKTTTMLAEFMPAIYATLEEAELALNPKDNEETMNAIYAASVQADAEIANNNGASAWLSEKNKENAMKNIPSSMR